MTSEEGGFYSAEDADSEGVEGKFYVWTPEELGSVLDPGEAEIAARYWDVTERGNFEGKNILHVPRPPETVAEEFGFSPRELWERIEPIRGRLFAAREERVKPGRDEKVLAAWNGLMLRSFALAARVTGREVYDNAAPSGTSVATEVLLRLSLFLDRADYRQRAEDILEELAGGMEKIPGAFGRLLCALDFSTSEPREVAIVGAPEAIDTRALLDEVYSAYLPNKIVAGRGPEDDEAGGQIPLLAQRTARDNKATAYVCIHYACQAPTTD